MADSKITGLTADTSPTSDDLVTTVTDPAGTPANRKVTATNLITKAHGLSDGIVKVASSTMTPATAGTDYYAPGSTDVAVADGGTGSSTEAGARTNLGIPITPASASGATTMDFAEDTDNGSNKITVTAPASIASDKTVTLPDATDTLVGKATTDTLTNKTLTASSNTLGGVTMGIGSDADGDMYYRASNVLTRLPKGTASQELRMNAGATAPEWYTPAAAGASTPQLKVTLADGASTETTGAEGTTDYASSGAGVVADFSNATGFQLLPSTATTGYARIFYHPQRTGLNLTSNLFSKNITMMAYAAVYVNSGFKATMGIGGDNGEFNGTATKNLSFRIERISGATTWYAVACNGTSETATDITSHVTALTGYNVSAANYWMPFTIVFTSGTEAKYYVGRSLAATITTNLPTGASTVTSNAGIIGAEIISNADSTASQSQFHLYTLYGLFDAY